MKKKLITFVNEETYLTLVLLKLRFKVASIGEVLDKLLEDVSKQYKQAFITGKELRQVLEDLSK